MVVWFPDPSCVGGAREGGGGGGGGKCLTPPTRKGLGTKLSLWYMVYGMSTMSSP